MESAGPDYGICDRCNRFGGQNARASELVLLRAPMKWRAVGSYSFFGDVHLFWQVFLYIIYLFYPRVYATHYV